MTSHEKAVAIIDKRIIGFSDIRRLEVQEDTKSVKTSVILSRSTSDGERSEQVFLSIFR